MHPVLRGLLAALLASMVLAALFWANAAWGPLRELDPAALVGRVLGEGRGTGVAVLWAFGVFGVGMAMAVLADPEPARPPWEPALTLSASGWVAAMMGLLPMAGLAPFGIGMGLAVPLVSAAWALLHGAALTMAWAWLPRLPELWQHWKAHPLPHASLRS